MIGKFYEWVGRLSFKASVAPALSENSRFSAGPSKLMLFSWSFGQS